ncbi:hypothetical protein ACWCXC_27895 [Streptomyces sp. NPDC001515]
MTVHQQAVSVGEFARHLREVAARLDPAQGWYGVFCRRDPEGMRACLDGVEIPPWDVLESLLTDLAALHGAAFAQRASVRTAELYASAAAAHDRRPGGRRQLVERLETMLRARTEAARRVEAARGDPDGADALAWARDDHHRASARCAELRRRLEAVTASPDGSGAEPAPEHTSPEAVTDTPAAAPARRKPRGARFAGLEDADDGPVAAPPVLPVPPPAATAPRGARFGGAARGADKDRDGGRPGPPDPAALGSARTTVATLLRLRAEGRSGEAHGVLCEAAGRPAAELPLLADELHRAGLGADWPTLLWEVASLPPAGFAAAADALAGAGRAADCGQLLRQGVARPAAEIADAALALGRAGRGGQMRALLGAFVRVRTPQDAAGLARRDPHRLVAPLLASARAVSESHGRDVEHALRVAGIG